jgi:hypothetical protein
MKILTRLHVSYKKWGPVAEIYTLRIALLCIGVTAVVPAWKDALYGKSYSPAVFVAIGSLAFKIIYSAIIDKKSEPTSSRTFKIDELSTELLRCGNDRSLLDRGRMNVDVFCYSCETFGNSLNFMLENFEKGKILATEISVRILVKRYDRYHVLPRSKRTESIESYVNENREKFNVGLLDIVWRFKRYRGESEKNGRKFSWEIRQYDFDPVQKGIIVNGKHVFWRLYPITLGHREMDDIWDANGEYDAQDNSVQLIEFRHDGAPAEAEAGRVIHEWFETVWESFSEKWAHA